jgi:hypothetical protein
MQKYGLTIDQLGPHAQAAAQAAERLGARTIVYRDQVPIAAFVPMSDIAQLDPPDPGASGEDPLLSLCGTCSSDAFVDGMRGELGTTMMFRPKK